MLFHMGRIPQQFVSSITAAVVLLTTLNCVCGFASPSLDSASCHSEEKTPKAHCAKDQQHSEHETAPCKHDDSSKHDPACNHCQASLVGELSKATAGSHLFSFSFFAPTFDTYSVKLLVPPQLHSNSILGDLPPPIGTPTLLSLHCALIT